MPKNNQNLLKHIYLDTPLAVGEKVPLPKDISHRLTRVLRYKAGQELAVFNGQDGLFRAVLADDKNLTIIEQLAPQSTAHTKRLYICLPKKDTFSRVLRQATEMNVTDLFPLFSTYTVPDKLNLERCQAILIEAAEQCERLTLPTLHAPQNLLDVTFPEPTLWAAERPAMQGNVKPSLPTSGILIGAEGGFAPDEVTHLQNQPNLHAMSLGDTILRTDTAVVAGLAALAS